MTKKEFNCRFLLALDTINPKLKHLASGSNNNHPNLRSVILKACKEDIEIEGFNQAKKKWAGFIAV